MAQTSRDYSLGRLSELGEKLEPAGPLLLAHPLCVCATGSYGRLEAWEKSDADVFFLYDDADETQRPRLICTHSFYAYLRSDARTSRSRRGVELVTRLLA